MCYFQLFCFVNILDRGLTFESNLLFRTVQGVEELLSIAQSSEAEDIVRDANDKMVQKFKKETFL